MIEVHTGLNVGNGESCRAGSPGFAVVHACKSPCHQNAVGYRGSLPSNDPNYLWLQRPQDLYLNLIDPPVPLFKIESFRCFLTFATTQYRDGATLLIHCNQGESRAPSLALLFLAKRLRAIPSGSFLEAKEAFSMLYPAYSPGKGIEQFLTKQWSEIS
jgi:hypothetical protein